MLEDEADAAGLGRRVGDVGAVQQDGAAVGRLQAGDDAQQRRLAAAAWAEQRGERAAGDVDRDVVERDEGAKALVDLVDLDRHPANPVSSDIVE